MRTTILLISLLVVVIALTANGASGSDDDELERDVDVESLGERPVQKRSWIRKAKKKLKSLKDKITGKKQVCFHCSQTNT